jgi:beta-1,4-mannosyl-glycoprotein beta-1,4-N-acetylglucosaminyltransferase
MKIIDSFIFFNELDLLEFRLKLLGPHVDHFVIAESNITHSGKPKPYLFEENKNRFEPWLKKITYIPLKQTAEGLDLNRKETNYNPKSAAWALENEHRNALQVAGSLAGDEDLVLLSDLDEIPNPFMLKKISLAEGPVVFSMRFHYYFFNCQNVGTEKWWHGSIVCTGKQFRQTSPQGLRDKRDVFKSIAKAGWHFSYLGGLEKIKYKIQSFAHTEFNKEEYLDDAHILKAMEKGTDIFKRPGIFYKFVSLYYYPSYLRKVMLEYPAFIHKTNKDNLAYYLYYAVKKIL